MEVQYHRVKRITPHTRTHDHFTVQRHTRSTHHRVHTFVDFVLSFGLNATFGMDLGSIAFRLSICFVDVVVVLGEMPSLGRLLLNRLLIPLTSLLIETSPFTQGVTVPLEGRLMMLLGLSSLEMI
eukprot:m.248350 g.248350  ORF g.248350 m.248350 type:complete len:125 (-) comp15413_c0_seq1:1350-1724(-)